MSWSSNCSATWATTLHKLISDEADDEWKSVIQRACTHPDEAAVMGQAHRMTPLHCACLRYPPNEAVKALVKACPQTAACQNREGETPLHLAAEGASEQVQLTLLKACPDALVTQDNYGDTPCHRAITLGSSTEVLEEFTLTKPEVVNIENKAGLTCFMLLPKGYVRSKCLYDISEDGEFWEDWESAMIFLKAASGRSPTKCKDGSFLVLHAAAATRSPRELLYTCIRLFPSHLLIRDSAGRVPLAIASRTDCFKEPEIDNDGTFDTEEENPRIDRNKPAVKILVDAESSAASVADFDGRYPLIHAIENGIDWEEGLEDILRAYPQCLNEKEPLSNMYPFMLAGSSKKSSITSIFSLLRANPITVQGGIHQKKKRKVMNASQYVKDIMHSNFVMNNENRMKKMRQN